MLATNPVDPDLTFRFGTLTSVGAHSHPSAAAAAKSHAQATRAHSDTTIAGSAAAAVRQHLWLRHQARGY